MLNGSALGLLHPITIYCRHCKGGVSPTRFKSNWGRPWRKLDQILWKRTNWTSTIWWKRNLVTKNRVELYIIICSVIMLYKLAPRHHVFESWGVPCDVTPPVSRSIPSLLQPGETYMAYSYIRIYNFIHIYIYTDSIHIHIYIHFTIHIDARKYMFLFFMARC